MDGFVSESTRAGHNADVSSLMDVTGHDANLALLWGNDTRAVGSNKTALALSHEGVFHTDHVLLGNSLCDAHNQAHLIK